MRKKIKLIKVKIPKGFKPVRYSATERTMQIWCEISYETPSKKSK